MAFASTVSKVWVAGSKRFAAGTWTNAAADNGGDIKTGLKFVDVFLWSANSHLGTEVVKVTKNTPNAGEVRIVTSENLDGDWLAIGL